MGSNITYYAILGLESKVKRSKKYLIFYIFEFLAKIVIFLTVRDRAKRTKIWDHMGSSITYWTILGLESEKSKKF